MLDPKQLTEKLKTAPTPSVISQATTLLKERCQDQSLTSLLLALLDASDAADLQSVALDHFSALTPNVGSDLLLAKLLKKCPSNRLVDEFITRLHTDARMSLTASVHPVLTFSDTAKSEIMTWIDKNPRNPLSESLLIEGLIVDREFFSSVAQNWLSASKATGDRLDRVRAFLQ